ncbi:hypothetical protein ACOMHN_036016 [Nucella lapillus]
MKLCFDDFSDYSWTNRPARMIHPSRQAYGSDPSYRHACRNCGKRYKLYDSMLRHRKKCEGVYKFQCNLCGRMYYRCDHYREHMQSKHGVMDADSVQKQS